jgi:hypothetical protein
LNSSVSSDNAQEKHDNEPAVECNHPDMQSCELGAEDINNEFKGAKSLWIGAAVDLSPGRATTPTLHWFYVVEYVCSEQKCSDLCAEERSMAKIIVKGGNLVWSGTPGRGGHIMFVLQWLEGLKRLGHEVLYYDRARDSTERANSLERARLFGEIIERWWDPALSAAVLPSGQAAYGLNAKEVEQFGRNAAAVISLGCTFGAEPEPWLAKIRPRVLVDLDPGFSQVWATRKSPEEIFGRHDFYFTVGANIGTSRCSLPTFGIEWRPHLEPGDHRLVGSAPSHCPPFFYHRRWLVG